MGLALGAGMAHAFKGSTTATDETTPHPYPPGEQGDLWLVAGQSNMAGFGTLKDEPPPDPRILFYANSNEWLVAKDPLERMFFPHGVVHGMVPDYTRLPVGGTGPSLFFARHVIRTTNRPIGLIGVATGRSIPLVWNPTLIDKGPMPPLPYIYGRMIDRVKQAGGYGKLKGMVWYQGESDAVQYPSAAKSYEQNLLNFIDRVRKDTGNPGLPVIVVQLCRLITGKVPGLPGPAAEEPPVKDVFATFSEAWDEVRAAQLQAAQKRPNVYLVGSVDLYPMADPIHLDFGAFERLGPRIGEVALSKVYNVPGHGTPIQPESVRVEPLRSYQTGDPIHGHALIRVRFAGVTGRLQAAGRPSGFSLRFPGVSDEVLAKGVPVIYTTEFDPKDTAAVLLRVAGEARSLSETFKAVLLYGAGLDPSCNIVDDQDMAVPAFGPITLGLPPEK
jgi:sialate O-acetylesterase